MMFLLDLHRAVLARAGDDHLRDARMCGALHYGVAVGVEAVVGEIDADVDEFRRSIVGHAGADHNDVPKPATNYAGPCRRIGAAFVYHSGGMTDDRCSVPGIPLLFAPASILGGKTTE